MRNCWERPVTSAFLGQAAPDNFTSCSCFSFLVLFARRGALQLDVALGLGVPFPLGTARDAACSAVQKRKAGSRAHRASSFHRPPSPPPLNHRSQIRQYHKSFRLHRYPQEGANSSAATQLQPAPHSRTMDQEALF